MAWNKATMGWALEGLGLPFDDTLPDEGVAARMVDSPDGPVIVWVRSVADKAASGQFMRVMAVCPDCNDAISVSRLPQHRGTVTCKHKAWKAGK